MYNPLIQQDMKYIVTLADGRKLQLKSQAMVKAVQRNAVVYSVHSENGLPLNLKFGIK